MTSSRRGAGGFRNLAAILEPQEGDYRSKVGRDFLVGTDHPDTARAVAGIATRSGLAREPEAGPSARCASGALLRLGKRVGLRRPFIRARWVGRLSSCGLVLRRP